MVKKFEQVRQAPTYHERYKKAKFSFQHQCYWHSGSQTMYPLIMYASMFLTPRGSTINSRQRLENQRSLSSKSPLPPSLLVQNLLIKKYVVMFVLSITRAYVIREVYKYRKNTHTLKSDVNEDTTL